MGFFVTLALCAKKQWLSAKEVIWGGAALIAVGAMYLYPICHRVMAETIGYNQKAALWGAAPVLFISVCLIFALRVIVQSMNAAPPADAAKGSSGRGKAAGPSQSSPAPRPKRSHGGKRRF